MLLHIISSYSIAIVPGAYHIYTYIVVEYYSGCTVGGDSPKYKVTVQ